MGKPARRWSGGRATFYRIGAEVEVRSDEEGYRGAWYQATVVRSHSKARYYTVSYSHLLHDESSALPLMETVHRSFIRFLPPPPSDGARFALHEPVDAFHCDGWWAGVIAEVPEGGDGLYSVCFPNTREEYKFGASQIRPQVEWINGDWAAVKDQEGDVMFAKGTKVEVSRDKENYGAAWFIGTVVKVIGKNNFLVMYDSLVVDGDSGEGMLLNEIVDLQYIRPSPPHAPGSKNFDVLDEVEAFHQDVWYAAVVINILPELRYIVKFKHREGQMELDHSALRPHLDWIDGHWIRSSLDKRSESPIQGRTKPAACRRTSHAGKRSSHANSRTADGEVEYGSHSNDVEGSSREDSGPHRKLKKGKHNLIVTECGPKTPNIVEKDSYSATPLLKENPGLINGHQHSERPCCEGIASSPNPVNFQLKSNPSLRDLHHGEDISQVNSMANSLISRKESSNCKGVGSDHQSKAASHSSPVTREAGDFLPIAEWGNSKDAHDIKGNNFPRIKKLVIRAPYRQRKPPDSATKQQLPEMINVRRDRLPGKREITKKHHTVIGTELKQIEETTDTIAERADRREVVRQSNCGASAEHFHSILSPCHRDKVLEHENSQLEENEVRREEIELPNCSLSVNASSGTLPPHHHNKMEERGNSQLKETADAVVRGEDMTEEVELSDISHSIDVSYGIPPPCHQDKMLEHENDQVKERNDSATETEDRREKVVEQHPLLDIKWGRGRPSKKRRILHKHHFRKGADLKELEETANVVEGKDRRKKIALFNNVATVDDSCDILPPCHNDQVLGHEKFHLEDTTEAPDESEVRREEVLEHGSSQLEETSDPVREEDGREEVVDKHLPQIKARKRGRPPKKRILQKQQSVVDTELEESVEATNPAAEKEDRRGEAELLNFTLSVDVSHGILPPRHHDKVLEHGNSQLVFNFDGGSPSNNIISIYCPNKQVGILEGGCLTPQRESSQFAKSRNSANPQLSNAISSFFNNMVGEIPSSVNTLDKGQVEAENRASQSHFEEGSIAAHNELALSGPQSERATVEMERAIIDPSCGSSSDKIVLPFTKRSPLWESIESMEVFQVMPQRPHFHPLEQYCEMFREGMAIGLMVTFANEVANVSKLQIGDSQESFEGLLKALIPLESNGFNVQLLRSRIGKLLEIRTTRSEYECKRNALKGKILEIEEKTDQVNAAIAATDKIIMELEESLNRKREKGASLILERENNDCEIVKLKMDEQAAKEAYHFVEQQFSTTLGAPW